MHLQGWFVQMNVFDNRRFMDLDN